MRPPGTYLLGMKRVIPVALAMGFAAAGLTTIAPVTVASAAPNAACTPGPKANCANAKLQKAQLQGKKLKGANLKGANLKGANLKGANLKNIDLRNTNLTNANLNGANLSGALLHGASGKGATFKGARGKRLRAHKADLRDTKWKGANLKRSSFKKTKLHRAAMQQSNVKQAKFNRAYLPETNLGGAKLANTDFTDADFGDMPDAYALPDDGAQIVKAIDAATQTVDIVIYEIGGPNIVGQAGSPGALMRAVSRGVNVRIMVNGQWYNQYCYSDTPQAQCATDDKVDWIYATQASLQAAAASASNPGSVQLNFANNNFQVTHQKTIIIDASDPNTGQPLPVKQLPATAQALVSSGNLTSYDWGYRNTTTPATACGNSKCPEEWAARDFFVVETDPELIAAIAGVFVSDLYCGAVPPSTSPSVTNTNNLLKTALPLTWSNGTTWPPTGGGPAQYPAPPTSYPWDLPAGAVVQGNAMERTYDLINSAKESIWIYNEEMNDPGTVAALVAQAEKGLDVRVMMTLNSKYAGAFTKLAKAGATIRLTQVDASQQDSKQLYIHAKMMLVDGTDAFMGSENISTASLEFNRELGVMLTSRSTGLGYFQQSVPAIHTFMNTFLTDWNTSGYLQWDITNGSDAMKQQAQSLEQLSSRRSTSPSDLTVSANYASGNYPMLCGPIPVRTTS